MGRHGENIRKRKDGRWEARIISEYGEEGKARYRSFYGKTYLEAKEKRNSYLKEYSQQQNDTSIHCQNNRKITVRQLMGEWMYYKKDYVKESTFAHYTNLLEKHILPQLGDVFLISLTSEKISTFLKDQLYSGRLDGKGGLSPKTVSDIRSIIMLGLEYAQQRQYPCSVKSNIFSPRSCKSEMKVLTRDEQLKLEKFLYRYPEPVALGILTTLYSGIRIGELCALRWGDIHFDNGTVKISKTLIRIQNVNGDDNKKTRILISSPKTESSNRLIPVPSFIMDFLIKFRRDMEAFLITGTRSYMEPRMCLAKYKQILKAAGVDSFTFHTLRHTFATRCIESGFDAKSLSEILGHANVNTTLKNYVHPSIELKKMQMERLQSFSVLGQKNGQTEKKNAEITSNSGESSYSVLL